MNLMLFTLFDRMVVKKRTFEIIFIPIASPVVATKRINRRRPAILTWILVKRANRLVPSKLSLITLKLSVACTHCIASLSQNNSHSVRQKTHYNNTNPNSLTMFKPAFIRIYLSRIYHMFRKLLLPKDLQVYRNLIDKY